MEAIENSIDSRIEIISTSTGEVTESDVLTAAPLNIPIISFNVKVPNNVAKIAENEKVKIKTLQLFMNFSIILVLLSKNSQS